MLLALLPCALAAEPVATRSTPYTQVYAIDAAGLITIEGQPPARCDPAACGQPIDAVTTPLLVLRLVGVPVSVEIVADASVPFQHLRTVVASAHSAGVDAISLRVAGSSGHPIPLPPEPELHGLIGARGSHDGVMPPPPPPPPLDSPPPPLMTAHVTARSVEAGRGVEQTFSFLNAPDGSIDGLALDDALTKDHDAFPTETALVLNVDDGVPAGAAIAVLDHATSHGYDHMYVLGGGAASGQVATAGSAPPSLVILGAMDQVDVLKVLAQPKFHDALDARARKSAPDLKGFVNVKFYVDGKGSVTSSVVKASDIPDEKMRSCVAAAFTGLKFPKPKGGGTLIISDPVFFGP